MEGPLACTTRISRVYESPHTLGTAEDWYNVDNLILANEVTDCHSLTVSRNI